MNTHPAVLEFHSRRRKKLATLSINPQELKRSWIWLLEFIIQYLHGYLSHYTVYFKILQTIIYWKGNTDNSKQVHKLCASIIIFTDHQISGHEGKNNYNMAEWRQLQEIESHRKIFADTFCRFSTKQNCVVYKTDNCS